jgi:peptide/nickel transport system substrate-binding protein
VHRCSPRLPWRRAVLGTTRATPHSDIAEAVWADLGQVSIRVHSLAAEGRQVITKTRAGQHRLGSLTRGSDDFDPETTAGTFCVSTDNGPEAPDRTLAWRFARQDRELREQGMARVAECDAEWRLALYGQMQREHIERSPFAIMLQQTDIAVLQPGVSGLTPR